MNKFQDIIDRVEEVRGSLKLNKSKFSNAIGMKPQTYNNFVGLQSSKPNVDLIKGVVNAFNVNPMWLINGIGKMFMHSDLRYPETSGLGEPMAVAESQSTYSAGSGNLSEIRDGLKDLKNLMVGIDKRLSALESR